MENDPVGTSPMNPLARAAALIVALISTSAVPVLPGQSTQTPTFRTRVDAVMVDVIATDSQGRPVTDLTAPDFEIKENGRSSTRSPST